MTLLYLDSLEKSITVMQFSGPENEIYFDAEVYIKRPVKSIMETVRYQNESFWKENLNYLYVDIRHEVFLYKRIKNENIYQCIAVGVNTIILEYKSHLEELKIKVVCFEDLDFEYISFGEELL